MRGHAVAPVPTIIRWAHGSRQGTIGMGNDSRNKLPLRPVALLAALCWLPATASAVPGDILFTDNFERAALFPWTTTNATVSGIRTGPQVSGSPTRGAFTRSQQVTITSPGFNAAVPAAEVSYWVRRGDDLFSEDPDVGEDLIIEYRRADGSWAQIVSFDGGGLAGQTMTGTQILPPDAMHASLALRVVQTNGSNFNFDWWHIDDLLVREVAVAPPLGIGGCDDFEAGLTPNWTINASTGFAGTNPNTAQSPDNSMYLNGGIVAVSSIVIDTSAPTFTDLTMWIRRGDDAFSEDPDNVENLVVEYLDDGGSWVALETFIGAGTDGLIYLRTYNLPPAGRHANFRLRFRQTAGSGATWDFWHIDDVCFVQQAVPSLVISKFAQTLSDPFNGNSNPKSIPGAVVLYTVGVTNQGPGTVDANTLVVTDPVAADSALFVDTSGGDPIVFVDGPVASGLGYSYVSDVTFSNQVGGGPPFNYLPTPDIDGFDPAVTGIRIAPSGSLNAAGAGNFPGFRILLRVRVQ